MSRELKLNVDTIILKALHSDPLDQVIDEIRAVQQAGGKLVIDPTARGYVIEVRPIRDDEQDPLDEVVDEVREHFKQFTQGADHE